MKNNLRLISPLLWIMLFDHTCLNITFPVLTLLFFDANSNIFSHDTTQASRSMWYGLAVAVPHIINIVVTPILCALSDEFGRKKILLVGTAGAFLFALIGALGVLWGLLGLVFFALILRGAFSRTNPIAQAVIGDVSDRQHKIINMGYLQTAISIGAFIGPIIGGYFANQVYFSQLNFSLPFFIAALFAAISCLLTLFIFKETLTTPRSWTSFQFAKVKTLFTNRTIVMVSAVLLLSQISWSSYYQFIPPILKTELHFTAQQLGWFVGMIALWLALATTFGIKWLDQLYSLRQILFISIYLILLGTVLSFIFCFYHLNILIWLAAIPTAVGDVIAYSCLITLYSDAVEIQNQGKVMGICFIVVALMWALTGLVGGALMSVYTLAPLVVAPIGIILALLLLHSKFKYSL